MAVLLVTKKLDPWPGADESVAPLPFITTLTTLTAPAEEEKDDGAGLNTKAPAVNVTLAFSPRLMLHAVSEGTPEKQ